MYMEQMKKLIHKKRTSKCVNITKQYKKMINYDDDTKGNIKYHNSERLQFFFFISVFLYRTCDIYMTAEERGGYLFNFSLPFPFALQTLKH